MPVFVTTSGLVDESPCRGCGWPMCSCLCGSSRTIEIEVESSRYADGAYWVPGAEYYAQKVKLIIDEDFDETQYTPDELCEMADDADCDSVKYA